MKSHIASDLFVLVVGFWDASNEYFEKMLTLPMDESALNSRLSEHGTDAKINILSSQAPIEIYPNDDIRRINDVASLWITIDDIERRRKLIFLLETADSVTEALKDFMQPVQTPFKSFAELAKAFAELGFYGIPPQRNDYHNMARELEASGHYLLTKG